MKIIKGDQVKIVTGKDRGKTGKVLRVFPGTDRLVVEGLNVFKKRSRPTKQGAKGEVIEVSRSLHASNVMLLCGNCKQATRVGMRTDGDTKVRYCKKCEATV